MSLVYVLSLGTSWICSGEGSSRGLQPADASNKNSPRGKRRETKILYSIGPFLTVILLDVTYLSLCLKLQNVIDVLC